MLKIIFYTLVLLLAFFKSIFAQVYPTIQIKGTNRFIASGRFGGKIYINSLLRDAGAPASTPNQAVSVNLIVYENGTQYSSEVFNNQPDGTGYNCIWSTASNLSIKSIWTFRTGTSSSFLPAPGERSQSTYQITIPQNVANNYNEAIFAPVMLRKCIFTATATAIPSNSSFSLTDPIEFTEGATDVSISDPESYLENGVAYFFDSWTDSFGNSTPKNRERTMSYRRENTNFSAIYRRLQKITLSFSAIESSIQIRENQIQPVLYGKSITLEAPETITDHSGQIYHFDEWSNGNRNRLLTIENVIDDMNITARYKGRLLSSLGQASSQSGSQRRFARDVSVSSVFYLVYESAGKIWLTYTTNGGTSWQPDRFIDEGTHPSLAPRDNDVAVAYTVADGAYAEVKVQLFSLSGNTLSHTAYLYNNDWNAIPTASPAIVWLGNTFSTNPVLNNLPRYAVV